MIGGIVWTCLHGTSFITADFHPIVQNLLLAQDADYNLLIFNLDLSTGPSQTLNPESFNQCLMEHGIGHPASGAPHNDSGLHLAAEQQAQVLM